MTNLPTIAPADTFSALLTQYMEKHGMSSVVQFAERANMKATTVYDLLSKDSEKRASPSLPTLIQLATALEMPTHELLYVFAPDAPGAPSRKQSAKDRLRAIGQRLPSTEDFLAQRRSDSRDER